MKQISLGGSGFERKSKSTQVKLANLAEVSRFTQAAYESGATDPNTICEKLGAAGIDVPHVLFGRSFNNLVEIDSDRL